MENSMDFDSNSDADYEEVIEECETDSEDEFDEIIPLKDDAKYVFAGHSDVVLTVVCDSKFRVSFTGGMDDTIIAWDLENGNQIEKLHGHSETILKLSINHTDSLLVSGDLQGHVIVWRLEYNPMKFSKLKSIDVSQIIDFKWIIESSTNEEYLYICDKTGTVQSFLVSSFQDENGTEMISTFYNQGKGCCCNGFNVILSGNHSTVLYGGSCEQFHEECSNRNQLITCDINTYSTTKIDLKSVANEEENIDEGLGASFGTQKINNSEIIAIGDWSQIILACTVVTGNSNVSCKLNRIPIKDGGLVTNLSFSDVLPYLAFASKNGAIGVFDLNHNRMRYMWDYKSTVPAAPLEQVHIQDDEENYEEQLTVSQLKWSPGKPLFYTAGLDGRLCCWDGRVNPSGDIPSWWGHSGIVWDMFVSKNTNHVITVSEDKTGVKCQLKVIDSEGFTDSRVSPEKPISFNLVPKDNREIDEINTRSSPQRTQMIFSNSIIRSPPQFVTTFTDEVVKEGDDVVLKCCLIGYPEPVIWWSYNTHFINDSRFEMKREVDEYYLYLRNIQKSDSGRYSITAENNSGLATCSALVIVDSNFNKNTSIDRSIYPSNSRPLSREAYSNALRSSMNDDSKLMQASPRGWQEYQFHSNSSTPRSSKNDFFDGVQKPEHNISTTTTKTIKTYHYSGPSGVDLPGVGFIPKISHSVNNSVSSSSSSSSRSQIGLAKFVSGENKTSEPSKFVPYPCDEDPSRFSVVESSECDFPL